MKLHFDAALVQCLFDHSKASPRRAPSLEQLFDGRYRLDGKDLDIEDGDLDPANWPTSDDVDLTLIPAGLWLVGDEGVYLMSNGDSGIRFQSGRDDHLVAYAAEADPKRRPSTHRDLKIEAFGSNDGVLLLDAEFIDQMLHLAVDGVACIDLRPSDVGAAIPDPVALAARQ